MMVRCESAPLVWRMPCHLQTTRTRSASSPSSARAGRLSTSSLGIAIPTTRRCTSTWRLGSAPRSTRRFRRERSRRTSPSSSHTSSTISKTPQRAPPRSRRPSSNSCALACLSPWPIRSALRAKIGPTARAGASSTKSRNRARRSGGGSRTAWRCLVSWRRRRPRYFRLTIRARVRMALRCSPGNQAARCSPDRARPDRARPVRAPRRYCACWSRRKRASNPR
mmetsp:Transcript_24612/g.75898  ORF Transcript_24612/g.75898 Transcript_24612/m.75898 type:complete len:223 (+) Transcript_24612:468-1136(+)